MASKVQSNQVVNEAALAEIGSALREEADDLFLKVNNRFVDLCSLSVTGSSKVVSIGSSLLAMPNGKYKAFPQLKSVDIGNISGSMDFGTGAGTGDIQTVVLPTMTGAAYEIRAGFYILSDKKIYTIFGAEGTTGNAAAPAFPKEALAIGEVLLVASASGTGNYVNPTNASLKQFAAGGSGGSGGSGTGGINYVDNFEGDIDASKWVTYNDGGSNPTDGVGGTVNSNFTLTKTSTNPLRAGGSFLITKAGTLDLQGHGVSTDLLPFDNMDKGRVINISFDYETTFPINANGLFRVHVYDITNGSIISSNDKLILNGRTSASFQFMSVANSGSYRLIFHLTSPSTDNYTFKFDNVVVGPANKVESLTTNAFQPAHGYVAGDVVYLNNNIWQKASASSISSSINLALVTHVIDANNFVLALPGSIIRYPVKAAGQYYLSETPGLLTQTNDQKISVLVGVWEDDFYGFFNPGEPHRVTEEGDLSFRPYRVTGSVAYLSGGAIALSNGEVLVSGSGTSEATVKVPISIDLSTVSGDALVNDTTYWLYIDRENLPAATTLSNSGRKVINVSQASNFRRSTIAPDAINPQRYVSVGYFRYATAAWSAALFGGSPSRFHDQLSDFFSTPEVYKSTTINTQTVTNLTHVLSGVPQLVQLYFWDNSVSERQPVDASSHVRKASATTITVDSNGFTFDSGDYLEVIATYIPVTGNQIASMSTQFESSWFENTSVTTLAHTLSDREDIKSFVVQEWDTATGRRRLLPPESLVTEFDNTNLYLDWAGFTPSSTLKYRITTGGNALPQSVPYTMGGFTKYVGMGAGSYATLALALAASAPGDAILVGRSETITAAIVVSSNDIKIEWMPLVKLSVNGAVNGITLSGSRCRLINPWVEGVFAGTVPAAIEVSGDDNFVDGAKVTSNLAGCTITTAYSFTAAAERSWINGTKRAVLGAITNAVIDSGTDNDYSVRG